MASDNKRPANVAGIAAQPGDLGDQPPRNKPKVNKQPKGM
jgi:hypothetical protein